MKTLLIKISVCLLVLAVFSFIAVSAAEDTILLEEMVYAVFSDLELPCNDELFENYVNGVLYQNEGISLLSISARETLGNAEKKIYDCLVSQIEKIANGTISSAEIELDSSIVSALGIKTTWTNTELGVTSITDFNAVVDLFWEQLDFSKLLRVLLHDCPYSLYWFDKTEGLSASSSLTASRVGTNTVSATIKTVIFKFQVASSYRASSYDIYSPKVNTQKTSAASVAAVNAREIVEKHSSLSDYEKLVAYRDEICALTEYNVEASLPTYTGSYGDPWQLIYVFDKDTSTNAVCEGYAKAFQYLFDLSEFDSEIYCYTVSGTTDAGSGAGSHMWNIVTMSDGKNYLVDITNSDTGAIGYKGELFLAGAKGNISQGYTITIDSLYNINYSYSLNNTILLWGTDSDSILNINQNSYTPSVKAIEALGSFEKTLSIEKTTNSDSSVTLIIKPKAGSSLPELTLYSAMYDSNNKLSNVIAIPCVVSNGKIVLNIALPQVSQNISFNIMLWTENLDPVINSIDSLEFFK